jgi:hypothetical protein
MKERIDYTKVAESVNYPALINKLDKLREKEPPKRRKRASDVLNAVTEHLLDMRAKGWTYAQLVAELKESGVQVTLSALRAHLGRAKKNRKAAKKSAGAGAH